VIIESVQSIADTDNNNNNNNNNNSNNNEIRGLSSRANYSYRATDDCRRS
jgi:hypothetical protein